MVYTEIVEKSGGRKPTFLFVGRKMPDPIRETIAAKVAAVAERVGMAEGIEIVETQLLGSGKHRLLRIYIDKPAGVTHSDCEFISHQVGTILDIEDVIPGGSYTLEVSSPGVERPLRAAVDFERFTGQKAKIVLREPVENQKLWMGTLAGCRDGQITLDAGNGKAVSFPLEQVQKANLKFDW